MMEKASCRWYAVRTKPRWEKKVAELLTKKKIHNYCPLNKVTHQWSDRKKIVLEPLFSTYLFVHIAETERIEVLQTSGVLNFVSWLSKPAAVRDEEIEIIKQFLKDHENIKSEKLLTNSTNAVLVMGESVLTPCGNEIQSKISKLILPFIGYQIIAENKKTIIEFIKTTD